MKSKILKFPQRPKIAENGGKGQKAVITEMPRAVTLTARIRHDIDPFEVASK